MFKVRQWGLDGISSPRNYFQSEALGVRTWNPVQSELEDFERLLILIDYSWGEIAKERHVTEIYWFIASPPSFSVFHNLEYIKHHVLFSNSQTGFWNKGYSNCLCLLFMAFLMSLIHKNYKYVIFQGIEVTGN